MTNLNISITVWGFLFTIKVTLHFQLFCQILSLINSQSSTASNSLLSLFTMLNTMYLFFFWYTLTHYPSNQMSLSVWSPQLMWGDTLFLWQEVPPQCHGSFKQNGYKAWSDDSEAYKVGGRAVTEGLLCLTECDRWKPKGQDCSHSLLPTTDQPETETSA